MRYQELIELSIRCDAADWIERVERACVVLEEAFPAAPLLWSCSSRDGVPDKQLEKRAPLWRRVVKSANRWFVVHNGLRYYGRRDGEMVDEGQVTLTGAFDDLAKRVYRLDARFPASEPHVVERILLQLGDVSGAYYAHYSPPVAWMKLYHPYFHDRYEDALKYGASELITKLPRLARPSYGAILDHPVQPYILGWLNYWSAETCEWLGFPDPQRDAELLSRSQKTAQDAWIVRIVEEPMDVRRREHIEALLQAYERFANLGMRRVGSQQHWDVKPGATQSAHVPAGVTRMALAYVECEDQGRTAKVLSEILGDNASSLVMPRSAGEWIALETQQPEILGQAHPAGRPVLAELCSRLGVRGFVYVAYGQAQAVLLEANGTGDCRLSGFRADQEPPTFGDFAIPSENMLIEFRWTPLAIDILNVDDYFQLGEVLKAQIE